MGDVNSLLSSWGGRHLRSGAGESEAVRVDCALVPAPNLVWHGLVRRQPPLATADLHCQDCIARRSLLLQLTGDGTDVVRKPGILGAELLACVALDPQTVSQASQLPSQLCCGR